MPMLVLSFPSEDAGALRREEWGGISTEIGRGFGTLTTASPSGYMKGTHPLLWAAGGVGPANAVRGGGCCVLVIGIICLAGGLALGMGWGGKSGTGSALGAGTD
jgi:hypothetical protein